MPLITVLLMPGSDYRSFGLIHSKSTLLKIGGEIGSGAVVGTDFGATLSGNVRRQDVESALNRLSCLHTR